MFFKEYPYNGKTEYQLINQINSNKILRNTGDNELNDLINRMLKINENERISWNNYFNHNFFKKDSIKQKLIKENTELQKENKDYKTKNNDLMKKGEELKNEIELLKKKKSKKDRRNKRIN